jgi:hypothetical protein
MANGNNENKGNKTMCDTQTIYHVFEKAGLGKAPFRLVAVQTNADRAAINRERESNGLMYTTNYCTSCDFCGTAIVNAYILESADGKRFKVGCDCVLKTGDKGLVDTVKRAERRAATEKRHAREEIKLAETREFFARADVQTWLASNPSPQAWAAAKGETYADCVAWFLRNAGTSGKLRIAAQVRKAMGGVK